MLLGQPNAFGILEPMAEAARLAHAAGALFVAVVEPVSLAVLAPPGEYGADIAVGEGQPLGIALQYGGPYLGLLAARAELVRQVPGRLVGRTTDLDGRRAYVMTLRAREQDIRRDKAASNICTNQALCALAATVYLATLGPHGLRDVAALGAARAAELETALAAAGAPRVHSGAYLNEFAVRVPDAPRVHAALLERGILAGLPLADWYPDDPTLRDALLVCATEVTTDDDIERFATRTARGARRDRASTSQRRSRPTRRAAGRPAIGARSAHGGRPGAAADAGRAVAPGPRQHQGAASAGRRAGPHPRRRSDARSRSACPSSTSPRSSATSSTCRSSTTRSTPASTRSARAR